MTRTKLTVPNASFEEGFYNYQDIGEITVASNWLPWWVQKEHAEPWELHRPEYKPETMRFNGQKFFTTFSTHQAGLYQQVAVPANAVNFELLVECQYWSFHTDGSGGGLAMRCGIEPGQGDDPLSDLISWGEWHGQDDPDGWDGSTSKTIRATVFSSMVEMGQRFVTLWIESRCRYPAKHNDAYFDGVELWADLGATEPEEPVADDLLAVLQSIDGRLADIAEAIEEMAYNG